MTGRALAGKTVAVVGVARDAMFDVTAAVEGAGGTWQAFPSVDPAALRRSDLVIAAAAAAPHLAEVERPILILGTVEEIAAHDGAGRDFALLPVNADEVVLRAAHLLAGAAQQRQSRAAASTPVVVAADDDPTTTAIVRTVVSQNRMTCHTADNGRKALETIRAVRPDVAVLDVNMPHMGGFEVLAALREDASLRSVCVLMLTSVQQEADIVRAFSLGADDYVVKPFNPMELLARIRRLAQSGR